LGEGDGAKGKWHLYGKTKGKRSTKGEKAKVRNGAEAERWARRERNQKRASPFFLQGKKKLATGGDKRERPGGGQEQGKDPYKAKTQPIGGERKTREKKKGITNHGAIGTMKRP